VYPARSRDPAHRQVSDGGRGLDALAALLEQVRGEEPDGFQAESAAAYIRRQRDPDLADAGRKAVLGRPRLDVPDQPAIALDDELQEAAVVERRVTLDLRP